MSENFNFFFIRRGFWKLDRFWTWLKFDTTLHDFTLRTLTYQNWLIRPFKTSPFSSTFWLSSCCVVAVQYGYFRVQCRATLNLHRKKNRRLCFSAATERNFRSPFVSVTLAQCLSCFFRCFRWYFNSACNFFFSSSIRGLCKCQVFAAMKIDVFFLRNGAYFTTFERPHVKTQLSVDIYKMASIMELLRLVTFQPSWVCFMRPNFLVVFNFFIVLVSLSFS